MNNMRIYKFKDKVDGKYAFIVAKNKDQAASVLDGLTSIPFVLVESKSIDELEKPIVLMNAILPF